jgi:hypothetical protein
VRWIPTFVLATLVGGLATSSDGAVEVLIDEPDRVMLRLDPVPFVIETDREGHVSVRVPGHGQVREPGRPVLPRLTTLIALPAATTPEIDLEDAGWGSRPTAALTPWSPAESEFGIEPSFREADREQPWPPQAVRVAWTGRLRGQDVAMLEWFPVRWVPADRTVLVSRGLTASVRFVSGSASVDGTASSPAGPEGDPYAESLVGALVRNPGVLGSVAEGVAADVDGAFGPWSTEAPSTDSGTAIAPVKLEITSRGIYRVSGSDLTSAGVDLTGVDPREIVVRNGPDLVDILLEGEGDGVFDPSDTIVFYGEGLDTRTTDTNVYWIETTFLTAPRMATLDVTPLGAPLAASFRNSAGREESALYTSNSPPQQPTEHWWWERLDAPPNASWDDSSDSYRVTLANLPTGASPARLLFNVQGRSNQQPKPDHNSRLFVNGTLVDDQMWNDIESFTHDVTFDASLLIEGENVITLELKEVPGVPFASLYSNWFRIEYDDGHVAESDRLRFLLEGGSAATVEVESFTSSSVEAFDVTDPAHPVQLLNAAVLNAGGTWTLRFQDAPSAEATYESGTIGSRMLPDGLVVDAASSWRTPGNGADLIVITHEDFASAVQPLVDLRVSEGLRVVKVLVEDVMDEFADGIYTPDAIRDFLQYAYESWARPAPAFVFLVGDANLDYRDFLGNGNNFVPAQLTENLPNIGEVMTDNFYVRVDGNDLLPDMYIGRVTPRTAAQAQNVIDKLVAYSQTPPAASVSDEVIVVADDGRSSWDPAFEDISDLLADLVPPALTTHKIYVADLPDNTSIRDEILLRVNAGAVITNYLGHGNRDIWGAKLGSSGSFWDLGDIAGLSNGTDQTFAIALNCTNGYFGTFITPVTMSERWLIESGKGGIGGWSPSGLGFLGDYDLLSRELFRRVFQEHDSGIGSATTQSLIRAFTEFGIAEDNMDELIVFGDPSMHLATDLDRDTILDRDEIDAGADPGDADTDDDGVTDGAEPSWSTDSDGDGLVNAVDYDSDDDALPDGLETGLTTPSAATDTTRGFFIADTHPGTTTLPLAADSDGGGAPDGVEDADSDGAVDPTETDPNDPGDDPACATVTPPEVTGLQVGKDGDDLVLTWDDLSGGDPCVLYRVYVATDSGTPDTFSAFVYAGTSAAPSFRLRGAAVDSSHQHYLVTANSIAEGEGPLGHYGL